MELHIHLVAQTIICVAPIRYRTGKYKGTFECSDWSKTTKLSVWLEFAVILICVYARSIVLHTHTPNTANTTSNNCESHMQIIDRIMLSAFHAFFVRLCIEICIILIFTFVCLAVAVPCGRRASSSSSWSTSLPTAMNAMHEIAYFSLILYH